MGVASTVFFLMECQSINNNWKTSMNVGALVTLIAAVHYFYMREHWVIIHVVNPWLGFAVGMSGWAFILFEIFAGEGGKAAKNLGAASAAVSSSFGTMRFIVSVGWSIYPLGYFFGYLLGAVSEAPLNLLYNLADFVNKIWFCLAIWSAAKQEPWKQTGRRPVHCWL